MCSSVLNTPGFSVKLVLNNSNASLREKFLAGPQLKNGYPTLGKILTAAMSTVATTDIGK
jgi:hypothetical protein